MRRRFSGLLMLAILLGACAGAPQQKENTANTETKTEQKENHGTVFHEIGLEEAMKKAKEEGKKVFIDCYTQSCGPCKQMVKRIFPQKACGEYLNSNFICLKKDMEKDEPDVNYLNGKYDIHIFPTYLILDTDSTLISNISGAILDTGRFIETIKSSISENKAQNAE